MSEELEKIAYQGHFELTKHYSSLLFKGRVLVVTISIAAWVYILGIHPPKGIEKIGEMSINLQIDLVIAYLSSTVILFLATMKVSYLDRIFSIIENAKKIEEKSNIEGVFKSFKRSNSTPFLAFDLINVGVMFAYFGANLPQSGLGVIEATLLIIVWFSALLFFLQSRKNARQIFGKDKILLTNEN